MTDQHTAFKAALARHYKAERDRSEECLGDIIKILDWSDAMESTQVEKILERLIAHYDRALSTQKESL